MEKLEHQEKGIDYFKTFILYIINARDDISIRDLYEVVKTISLERSEEIMTIAEQLIKEGMEKGMEKGRQEGIEKTTEAALRKGADIDFVAYITGLSMKRLQEIERKINAEKS